MGGNVALGISLACARLASINFKIPFYKYLYFLRKGNYNSFIYKAPRILFNIAEGGVHADNNLEFQEHLVSFKNQAIFSQIQNLKEFNSLFLNIIKRENKKIVFGDEGGWAGNYQNEEALINTLFDLKLSSKGTVDADGDVYSDDITSLGELKSKLEDILEDLAQKREQEEYDDDSDYYRENFESIAENCACRAYEDLKDDWIIEHLFYYGNECENAIAKLDVNVEWLID